MPTYRMIFLGNFPDIDPDERDFDAERAFQTFRGYATGSPDAPLYKCMVRPAVARFSCVAVRLA